MKINSNIIAVSHTIPSYKVPVGFPKSRGVNHQNINSWIQETNPDFTKKITPLSIVGMISSVLGIVVAFFSKSEFRVASVLSSIGLLAAGIFTMVAGLFDENGNADKEQKKNINNNTSAVEQSPLPVRDSQNIGFLSTPSRTDDEVLSNNGSNAIKSTEDKQIADLINTFNNQDNDVELRKRVAILLGKNQHRRAQKPLTDCIKRKTDDSKVRSIAAYALGLRTKPHEIKRAVSAMLPRLLDEKENLMVRQHIAIALSEIGDYDILKWLRMLRDTDVEMFETTSYAINRIEDRLR